MAQEKPQTKPPEDTGKKEKLSIREAMILARRVKGPHNNNHPIKLGDLKDTVIASRHVPREKIKKTEYDE